MSRLQHYLAAHYPDRLDKSIIAYLASLDHLESVAPDVAKAIVQELRDQRAHLKLIASENYSSLAVQLAMGNLLTDKYAEGYPHHRFYAGCENVDTVEDIAVEELKKLFNCEHAYVQPHSGADANLVAFWAILLHRVQNREMEKFAGKKIDELSDKEHEQIRHLMLNQKILGMSLNSGGHLTHGYRHNASSKIFHASHYDVEKGSEIIDYSKLAKQVKQERPDILLAGYSAHPRKLNFAKMKEIADSVGAVLMVDMAHFAGLVAGKVFTGDFDPIPFADIVTSTTHKTLRGPRGGVVLCKQEFAEAVDKGCPMVLGGPLPHVIAAKAIAFKEANAPEFRHYSQRIVENADSLSKALIAQGVRLVTGGTENHMVILDIGPFGITGRQAEMALREAWLTVNRNAIPFDENGPWYTSGIRIGTPAVTTLGMGKNEMEEIASIIVDVLRHTKPSTVKGTGQPSKAKYECPEQVIEKCRERVRNLLHRFPLYKGLEL